MKQIFSTKWKSSKQVRKQRKYIYNMPLHLQNKLMSAHLEKTLRTKYGMRNIAVRKGDEVKIMKGKFKGKTGKVDVVELQKKRVTIEGINNTKKDGTAVKVWFHPSNLMIKTLNLDDNKRLKGNKTEIKTENKEDAPKKK